MKAAPGAEVGISYDGDPLEPGNVLETPTGRRYGIVAVRLQTKGKHLGRQYLRCVVLDEKPAPGTKIFPLFWNHRGRVSDER